MTDYSDLENPPSAETQDFAAELHQWLESVVDPGTRVDTGGGFAARDFWVRHGGHEFYISVTDKGPRGATRGH